MASDELKAALRQLSEMMEKPCGELKGSTMALCLAQIGCAIEDDDLEVPAEVFECLSPVARKFALAGLCAVVVGAARA